MKKLSLSLATVAFLSIRCSPYNARGSVEWASGVPDGPSRFEAEIPSQEITNEVVDELLLTAAPQSGLYFAMDKSVVQLAHGPAQFWLGCEAQAAVRGGYDSDTTCGRAYFFPNYAQHLNSKFFNCIERGASAAGYKKPERVFIRHLGSYNDRTARGSSRLSMHAYARALDIANFNLVYPDGKFDRVSTHVKNYKGATQKFYDEFRQCWKESMPKTCKPSDSEGIGSIGIPGSKLGGNSLHNDHIHLSYPLCAR